MTSLTSKVNNNITQANTGAEDVETSLPPLVSEIINRVRAGYQIIWLHTPELIRAEDTLRTAAHIYTAKAATAEERRHCLYSWDTVRGFSNQTVGPPNTPEPLLPSIGDKNATVYVNAAAALDAIAYDDNSESQTANGAGLKSAAGAVPGFKRHCMFVFYDLDEFMKDPRIKHRLLQMAAREQLVNSEHRHPLFIVSANADIDVKLRPYISVLDLPLPTERELLAIMSHLAEQAKDNTPPDKDLQQKLVGNLSGMTQVEATNVIARAYIQHRALQKQPVLPMIKAEKAMIVAKSEVLTYIPESSAGNLDDVRGFEEYIDWLRRRKVAYTATAREQNIDTPRGVVFLGIPGTGKSQAAKATCLELGLPGYILDVGALFGSMVGESEKRVREVLRLLDAQQGCVLVIDEADKALGNAHQSTGDSGVTRRVFGQILTWLAENKSNTFVIMTLNRTEGIPPEMLRAGRFDKLFYTDLPSAAVRQQIFEVHFKKRGVTVESLQFTEAHWARITEATDRFVGAEIEEVVRESRYRAMEQRNTGIPEITEVLESIASITPMARTEADAIEAMRAFCKAKGSPVTRTSPDKKVVKRSSGRTLDVKSTNPSDN